MRFARLCEAKPPNTTEWMARCARRRGSQNRPRDHRHVDQHAIALAHAQALHHRRATIDLGMQFSEAVGLLGIGFGGDENQRILVEPVFEVAVDRVIAKIGLAPTNHLAKGGRL